MNKEKTNINHSIFTLENKNIVFLLKSFDLGGAEKQALFLASYLKKNNNCKVFIYAYIQSKDATLFYAECEKLGLHNTYQVANPLSASGKFKYLKRRIKLFLFGLKLRKHKPDLIIPYLNPPSIIASLVQKSSGAKKMFWHHRGPDYYRGDAIEKKAVDKCSLFIANSPDGKKELESVLEIENAFFLANYTTLTPAYKRTSIPELENLPSDKLVLGMIAHFRIQKLQHLVVEAFAKLIEKNKNVHLVLAGNINDAPEEKSNFELMLQLIKKNNLHSSITVLHNCKGTDVASYLDIGLLFSTQEGMPNVLMEYMAFGLPVIATQHEGCKELLGPTSDLLIANDLHLLVGKLELLVDNKKLRNSVGKENKKRLFELFTIEKYTASLTKLLNQ